MNKLHTKSEITDGKRVSKHRILFAEKTRSKKAMLRFPANVFSALEVEVRKFLKINS